MGSTSTGAGLTVEVTGEIHADSRDLISRGLAEFNAQHLGDHKWVDLDVYVRDTHGKVVAGLIGGSVFDRFYVYALWVAGDRRQLGLGTRILRAAEQAAIERGCRIVFLDTLTFQAPAFYEKRGYQRIATVDLQPGVRKIDLQKRLPE
jgi:ribosomal protein S18 acetylase RimI-like enzyme